MPSLEQQSKALLEGKIEEAYKADPLVTKSDIDRVEFFKKTLEKELGLKSTMTVELKRDRLSGPRYKLDFNSRKVHVGSTQIWVDSGFGDTTFGKSTGLFTADKIITLQDKVMKAFIKKFPKTINGQINTGF